MALSWSDQPKVLDGSNVLFSGMIGERLAEVRHTVPGPWYVTQGNLFGSQTLECENVEAVFRALNAITNGKKGMKAPEGCRLMEEEKEDA